MLSRRALLGSLAALPLLGGAGRLGAQTRRMGGAPILVQDQRVWMQVRFGTRGPYAFVIDTGAFTNMIRRDLARTVGMRQLGDRILHGVGGTQQMSIYEGADVTLGTIDIGTADFAAYESDDLRIHREAMGALSTGVLTVADSDLDFSRGEWRIYADGRGDRAGFEQLQGDISRSADGIGAAPFHVEVRIGGETCRLQVDTGAPGNISLWPRATRRLGLWTDAVPYAPGRRTGVGGAGAASRLVRGPDVRIGSATFARPLLSLTDPESRDALPSDGLLGIGLIERMNWSTEVGPGRVWVQPSGRPAPPDHYGLSGLWVDERGGRAVVARVSPRSPAAEAGLQVGDEIANLGFRALIGRVGGPPGTRIPLDYRRGGQAGHTELVLREFL
jgi:serine protease Do